MPPVTARRPAPATAEARMGLKLTFRYFEKQHLRPFMRKLQGLVPSVGAGAKVPAHLQTRIESLEARVAELEQLIQEDLGLRLAQPDQTRESDERA